jgi:hypothetical protein
MRKAVLFVCLAAVSAALVGSASGAEPETGTLSVEDGRGVFTLEVRGSTLGTLSNGSLVVVDRSLSDPYVATITGRRVVQRKVSPTRVQVRGWGLRFRMLGGSYRVVIRGTGLALSTVGRGYVLLDGEPHVPGDDMGVYSLDGADCSTEPQSCVPVPDDPIRLKLAGGSQTDSGRQSIK